jgi:hypothetical protein
MGKGRKIKNRFLQFSRFSAPPEAKNHHPGEFAS